MRALIAAAYAVNDRFGLFIDVLAVTGARPSQAARLEVGDLRADELAEAKAADAEIGKGGGRYRVKKKIERTSVPITPGLATPAEGGGCRACPSARRSCCGAANMAGAPIHPPVTATTSARSSPIGRPRSGRHAYTRCGTASIVRQLLAGVPIRLVAALHDTSVTEIERHYSKHIAEHSDVISRRALLADEPPIGANVIQMAR